MTRSCSRVSSPRATGASASSKGSIFLVATLDDRPAWALASPHVRVLGVSVARDVRGLGLGTELIGVARGWGVRHGATKNVT